MIGYDLAVSLLAGLGLATFALLFFYALKALITEARTEARRKDKS